MVYGRHPVVDAIESGMAFDKLMLQQQLRGPFEKEIRALSKKYNIPLQVVPKERLSKLVKGNHQGVIGFVSLIRYYQLADLLPMLYEQTETPLVVVLDRVTDVRNLGAIARSVECLGGHALVLPKKSSAPINALAMKTSAGALANLPVCREANLGGAIELLQMSGLQVIASGLNAHKTIVEIDFKLPTAILMGSEGEGVNPIYLTKVDQTFIIPQSGKTDSLNVSVATGIIMYEASRQRKA